MTLTQEELDAKIARWQCCSAHLAHDLLKAQQRNDTKTAACIECKLFYLLEGIEVLNRYVVPRLGEYNDDYSEDYFI